MLESVMLINLSLEKQSFAYTMLSLWRLINFLELHASYMFRTRDNIITINVTMCDDKIHIILKVGTARTKIII